MVSFHHRPPGLPPVPMHAVWPHGHTGPVFVAQRLVGKSVVNKAVNPVSQRPVALILHRPGVFLPGLVIIRGKCFSSNDWLACNMRDRGCLYHRIMGYKPKTFTPEFSHD